jgi:hypothetical protein
LAQATTNTSSAAAVISRSNGERLNGPRMREA